MPSDRIRRINEGLREAIGEAISNLSDPRIGFVTVTAVDTSPDLRAARVHVSVLGDEQAQQEALEGLGAAHGVIQGAIASSIRMKRTPTLSFHYDEGPARAVRLTRMLDGGQP